MVQAQVNSPTYYDRLGLHPSASVQQIRQAYRERSKLYHPDTTQLEAAIATAQFLLLNEAYATLCNPERRTAYDLSIGYSRLRVIQPLPNLYDRRDQKPRRSSAYLDPTDRPLSAGEMFALFLMGVTLLGCLALVLIVGTARGEISW
jgi:curved DNA-binding protein CbpA